MFQISAENMIFDNVASEETTAIRRAVSLHVCTLYLFVFQLSACSVGES